MIRLELGYGLLPLAGGDQPKLTEQIKALRRTIASEMGFVLPPVRIQDNMQLGSDGYSIRIKEIEAGKGELRPTRFLVMDPRGGVPDLPGEKTTEPAFGLAALWIDAAQREEAMFRGCTVVDPVSVLTTHLTETVRETMAELLSYSETQKLLDELPREQQKLVADLIPSQISMGAVQRVLQALLSERISIRDLPTILEGIQEACGCGNAGDPPGRRPRTDQTGAPDQRRAGRPGRLHPADPVVAAVGGSIPGKPGRTARGSPARHGAEPAERVHRAAAHGARRRCRDRRVAGGADQQRHPRPGPRHRRAPAPGDPGAGAIGDLPARPHPHDRQRMIVLPRLIVPGKGQAGAD